jgi:hypothetical protein
VTDPVQVFAQIAEVDVPAGHLWSHRRRGTESATFRYASEYLVNPDAYQLDPGLGLFEGAQQTAQGQALFGAFSDCAPNRWGRRLVERAERHRAVEEESAERSYGEIDYLLRVRDDLRQGALRFRYPDTDEFLWPEHMGIPPFMELDKLSAPRTTLSETVRTPTSSRCCYAAGPLWEAQDRRHMSWTLTGGSQSQSFRASQATMGRNALGGGRVAVSRGGGDPRVGGPATRDRQ